MKRIKEEFNKKTEEVIDKKRKIIITRRLVHEEDFELSLEEIERMEKNANARIALANRDIEAANEKLEECQKLREMLK